MEIIMKPRQSTDLDLHCCTLDNQGSGQENTSRHSMSVRTATKTTLLILVKLVI